MPSLSVESVDFTYAMTVTTVLSDQSDGYPAYTPYVVPGTTIGYAICGQHESTKPNKINPPSLWITGMKLKFNAQVTANGAPSEVRRWSAGMMQTIYKSERFGDYTNHAQRLFKFDTSVGPLCDGKSPPFCAPPKTLTAGAPISIDEDDAPNFKWPLTYTDATHPDANQLIGTWGEDQFRTFLVVVRDEDKTVVILSTVQWRIDWDGTYKAGVWKPADPRGFLTVWQDHSPTTYRKLKACPQFVPFSTRMDQAEAYAQLYVPGDGWTQCSTGGKVNKQSQPKISDNWVTSQKRSIGGHRT